MERITQLLLSLKQAALGDDQVAVNFYAKQLADILYDEKSNRSYEDLLNQLGYKDIDKQKRLKKEN